MPLIVYYNGTHYQDGPDTSPIDHRNFFISIVILAAVSAISCAVVIGSVLWSKKASASGFNLYLIFLLIPDLLFNIRQCIVNILILKAGVFPLKYHCMIGAFTTVSYVMINLWMNVLIAHEVYQMLQHSHQAKRYKPSSPRIVFCRVSIVYIISIIFSMLTLFNTPLIDGRLDSKNCIPTFFGSGFESFIARYAINVLAHFLPCIYLIYIAVIVRKNNLLPPGGKSRFLALFFFRVAIITVCFTATGLMVILVDSLYIFLVITIIQGILVSLTSLQKEDIYAAVKDTFFCSNSANDISTTTTTTT